MSKVVVHRHATRYLQHLPKNIKQRIKNVLKQLEQNPLDLPGVKHMAGEWSGYHRLEQENTGSSIGSMIKRILFTWITSAPGGMCISECCLASNGARLFDINEAFSGGLWEHK